MNPREKILERLRAESKGAKLIPLAQRIGIHYTTLWRIVRGFSGGSANVWDKIFSYYKK